MTPSPARLVAYLAATGQRPAALVGDWFGHAAVVAPDVALRPVAAASAFSLDDDPSPAPSPDSGIAADSNAPDPIAADRWTFGWLPYSGEAFSAGTRDVLLFDGDAWSAAPGASAALAAELPHLLAGATAFELPDDPVIDWDEGDRAAHERGVLDCLESIRAGDVYQACLSTRFHGTVAPAGTALSSGIAPSHGTSPLPDIAPSPGTASPAANPTVGAAAGWWARRVVTHSPVRAAFLAGIDADERDVVVASLSPEEFLVRDGATVRESPIKGTVPLTADPAELAASRKDVAENIMIVDLVRHDLGQVAVTGGVRVTDLLAVRPAPGVWHLVSEVTAQLPAGLPHADLIGACFPPASVTGTPKIRAAELIAGWEPVARGVHCGAIGAAAGGALELNVAIRTAEFRGPGPLLDDAPITVDAGVGGGITIDSDPAAEWDEILAKAAPLLRRI
ncbi:chorismate-binding protein [Corynebacterium sp. NPDC060344]|uniref:chorismate-binding protein n=1 Tax=Corynebacterium sp. NPDC060344 TaxID=3347101 RepID=UPI00364858A0